MNRQLVALCAGGRLVRSSKHDEGLAHSGFVQDVTLGNSSDDIISSMSSESELSSKFQLAVYVKNTQVMKYAWDGWNKCDEYSSGDDKKTKMYCVKAKTIKITFEGQTRGHRRDVSRGTWCRDGVDSASTRASGTFKFEANGKFSLKELFTGNPKPLGDVEQWRSAMHCIQPHCNAMGFHPKATWRRCRFGIVTNNENDCNTPDHNGGVGCATSATGSYASCCANCPARGFNTKIEVIPLTCDKSVCPEDKGQFLNEEETQHIISAQQLLFFCNDQQGESLGRFNAFCACKTESAEKGRTTYDRCAAKDPPEFCEGEECTVEECCVTTTTTTKSNAEMWHLSFFLALQALATDRRGFATWDDSSFLGCVAYERGLAGSMRHRPKILHWPGLLRKPWQRNLPVARSVFQRLAPPLGWVLRAKAMIQVFRHGIDITRHQLKGIYVVTIGTARKSDEASSRRHAQVICTLREGPAEDGEDWSMDGEDASPSAARLKNSPITLSFRGQQTTLRPWDPSRCALSAALHNRLVHFPVQPKTNVFAICWSLQSMSHISDWKNAGQAPAKRQRHIFDFLVCTTPGEIKSLVIWHGNERQEEGGEEVSGRAFDQATRD
eukprot:g21537.t1